MEIDLHAVKVLDEYEPQPTRTDIEWLNAVSDWCRAEASRLEEELGR
jgi:hypothetical protein